MLEFINVTKRFNTTGDPKDTITALDNVSFKINDGDFVTIIGSNGSGKSTSMNIITGVIQADSGSIVLDGTDITKQKEYQRAKYFGRVFQDPMMGTAGEMSVLENLEIAYRRGQKHSPFKWGFKKEHKEIFIEKLSKLHLGLEEKLNQKVGVMSGGQRQALTLLMASFANPKMLLLDEHTAALDPKTASRVLHLTERIVETFNITTLMVTHNMKDAITYGNRLIMFHNGHIIHDFNAEEKKNLTVEKLLALFDEANESLLK